eukprot:CAMPEP_0185796728 /NCGR_PEP_ID=MMETSP1174-20130828/161241_1 /TAXON_ID=35687 /ORGANISM="Dictyocha speculum, Strain CCMP1381" /LENGTH=257 /DNA_ID=CAMNT_0028492119 /DNA_START=534 /DNA_END=1304 /DNA_ORIENTATION=-
MTGVTSYTIRDRASALVVGQSCAVNDVMSRSETTEDGGGSDLSMQCSTKEELFFAHLYQNSLLHRYAMNSVQPNIVRSYSSEGYLKLPLPQTTYEWLQEWYLQNEELEEQESNAGAVGTQHEVPWFVRHVPGDLKDRLALEVRPMLAEWSGFTEEELELTSCYGIRRYVNGSKLRMHVDTVQTHAVSVIINVAQENMEEDWVLEIKTHDGTYSYVTMTPGDVVLYESAKCLHGRPDPLKGDSYANIFLHFKPGLDKW